MSTTEQALITLEDVSKVFKTPDTYIIALDRVDITLSRGTTVGIVGESGCGKSTLGRVVAGLSQPTEGTVNRLSDSRGWKQGAIQMVFQDPGTSLNPRQTIWKSVSEPMRKVPRSERRDRAISLLQRVGLDAAYADALPGRLSGGQQQRVCIARSIAGSPRIVVHDESLTSLDVSLQAQVINLLLDLQDELGVGYMFISHDLRAVRAISHIVYVMYLGRVVEVADVGRFRSGELLHPYSVLLRAAEPTLEGGRRELPLLKGEIGNRPERGCNFAPRCPLALPLCHEVAPALVPVTETTKVACHRPGEMKVDE